MSFEDHFSRAAQDYARHRPSYPTELFSYLASVSPGLDLAWDCGTGNGQAVLPWPSILSALWRQMRGRHPLRMIWEELSAAWGDADQTRDVDWPLHLRIGRV